MSEVLKFPRGSVILFTTGEYSDFGLGACVVTLVDCDLPALAQAYEDERRADPSHAKEIEDGYYTSDLYGFAGWLIAHGHAFPGTVETVHLGEYGSWSGELRVESPR